MSNFELFLKRTDELARKLRFTHRELCSHLGLSQGSYFGYRTGRSALSSKAWRKLEAAEKAAGIGHEEPSETVGLRAEPSTESNENQLTRELIAKIDRLTDLVELLIEQRATSSSDPGQVAKAKGKNLA